MQTVSFRENVKAYFLGKTKILSICYRLNLPKFVNLSMAEFTKIVVRVKAFIIYDKHHMEDMQ